MLGAIFTTIFYQPLLNALVLIYQLIPGGDFGLAVIFLTVLIKVLLLPLNLKALKSQQALVKLEPKLKEIREKLKHDQEKMAKEIMMLYKEAGINPLISIVLLFIQMPVLIALYQVFSKFASKEKLNYLYSFILYPSEINLNFLTIDLSKPGFSLAFLAGILLFFQVQLLKPQAKSKKKDISGFSAVMQKQMNYFLPVFSFLVLLKVPSVISLYFVVSNIVSIIQAKYL